MKQEMIHTPTPWRSKPSVPYIYGAAGGHAAEARNPANRAFIVRACNAHDELVDLLGRALSYVTETGSLDRMGNFVHDDTPSNRLCEKIRAALAKAKGEQ